MIGSGTSRILNQCAQRCCTSAALQYTRRSSLRHVHTASLLLRTRANAAVKSGCLVHHPNDRKSISITRRPFSYKGRRARQTRESGPLHNEDLISKLLTTHTSKTIDTLQVRVVGDPLKRDDPNYVSTSTIVSLRDAIQQSLDTDKDLVAVTNIEQEIPVVTLSDSGGLAYQSHKKKKKSQNTSPNSIRKELSLSAGIAPNDLERKLTTLRKFLDKGHPCVVRVVAKYKQRKADGRVGIKTAEMVLEKLSDVAEVVVPISFNEAGVMGSFQVRPKKKTS